MVQSSNMEPFLTNATKITAEDQTAAFANEAPNHDELMVLQEASPAYQMLKRQNLLTSKYRIQGSEHITLRTANSTLVKSVGKRAGLFAAGVIPGLIDCAITSMFSVAEGHIRLAQHQNGEFFFYGPGVHRIRNAFISVHDRDVPLTETLIKHGNCCIVTIRQGYIGLCMDRGQPVLLSPGMHQWKSDTLFFEREVDLAQHVIVLGPYTLLTVDEGYAAVTQNNGKQVILPGGEVHMLTHRNWKFEKFITKKIQTCDLQDMRATTGDNVVLQTHANVNWWITDVDAAARTGAETMRLDGQVVQGEDISNIRSNVLKQCKASLAMFVGSLRYSDSVHVDGWGDQGAPAKGMAGAASLFDAEKLKHAVEHANGICGRFGVEIISINIISATPVDKDLSESLTRGATAVAEAERAETAAQGVAKALMVQAKAEADAARIKAQADADSERIRAQGAMDAAQTLEKSNIAVELAKISKTGEALDQKTTFFFGGDAQQLPSLLANPAVVKADA